MTIRPCFEYEDLAPQDRDFVRAQADDIRRRLRRATDDVLAVGTALLSVKARLGHGRFLDWLKTEFGWDARTARRYMRAARLFKTDTLSVLPIDASALHMLAARAVPDSARAEAVAAARAGTQVDAGLARRIVVRHRTVSAVAAAAVGGNGISQDTSAGGVRPVTEAEAAAVVSPVVGNDERAPEPAGDSPGAEGPGRKMLSRRRRKHVDVPCPLRRFEADLQRLRHGTQVMIDMDPCLRPEQIAELQATSALLRRLVRQARGLRSAPPAPRSVFGMA